jgi:hypothetical protein
MKKLILTIALACCALTAQARLTEKQVAFAKYLGKVSAGYISTLTLGGENHDTAHIWEKVERTLGLTDPSDRDLFGRIADAELRGEMDELTIEANAIKAMKP